MCPAGSSDIQLQVTTVITSILRRLHLSTLYSGLQKFIQIISSWKNIQSAWLAGVFFISPLFVAIFCGGQTATKTRCQMIFEKCLNKSKELLFKHFCLIAIKTSQKVVIFPFALHLHCLGCRNILQIKRVAFLNISV